MTFPGQQPYPQPGFPQQPQQQPYPQQPQQQPYGNGYPQQPQQQAFGGGFPQQQPAAPRQQFSDPNSFLMGGGIPPAQFPQVGASVAGLVEDLEVQQQRDLDSGAFLWWDEGTPAQRPREQLVVTIATDQRDPANPLDDGRRKLYVKGGSMPQAIAKACRAAGHPEGIAIGGRLLVQYVGDGEPAKRGHNPPKQYAAQYVAADPNAAANAALMGGNLEQQASTVVPFPAQPQQAPAGFAPQGPAGFAPQQQPVAPAGSYGYLPGVQQTMPQQPPVTGDPAAAYAAAQQAANAGGFPNALAQPQQPAAAPAVSVPADLPPNVQAALAQLPPEQQAAALAQWQAQQGGQQQTA